MKRWRTGCLRTVSYTHLEGASIAHGAYLNKIPFIVIRAISDKADGSAEMDYTAFEHEAAKHSARLVEDLVQKIQ